MTFLLWYLAIGVAVAFYSHRAGKVDRLMEDSVAEGITNDINLVVIAVAIGTLFLWPLLLASCLQGFFED